jgi:hypothetical protein
MPKPLILQKARDPVRSAARLVPPTRQKQGTRVSPLTRSGPLNSSLRPGRFSFFVYDGQLDCASLLQTATCGPSVPLVRAAFFCPAGQLVGKPGRSESEFRLRCRTAKVAVVGVSNRTGDGCRSVHPFP